MPVRKGTSIAIVPFEDLHDGEDLVYFSRGLTEDISSALSRFDDITVFSPRSTAIGDDAAANPNRLGKDMGVRYVLSGSVRRDADSVRVSAKLIDVEDGTQVWSESYDRDLTAANLFALQDDIAARVVGTLADPTGVIAREAIRTTTRVPPKSIEAYDCVLRAYQYFDVHTDKVHAYARDCLEAAGELEPDYADAWAHLAFLYRCSLFHQRGQG